MKNKSEREVWDAWTTIAACQVLRSGWPDFLIWDPLDNKLFCIEVKRPGGRPTESQRRMHEALAKAGIETIVVEAAGDDSYRRRVAANVAKWHSDVVGLAMACREG